MRKVKNALIWVFSHHIMWFNWIDNTRGFLKKCFLTECLGFFLKKYRKEVALITFSILPPLTLFKTPSSKYVRLVVTCFTDHFGIGLGCYLALVLVSLRLLTERDIGTSWISKHYQASKIWTTAMATKLLNELQPLFSLLVHLPEGYFVRRRDFSAAFT